MKKNDLLGKRFTSWEVISFDRVIPYPMTGGKYTIKVKMWICRCDCGVVKPVNEQALIRGKSKSCKGCSRGKTRFGAGNHIGSYTVTSNFLSDKKYAVICDCGVMLLRRVSKLNIPHKRCILSRKFKREVATTGRKGDVVADFSGLGTTRWRV